jgi:hypothetical protein
MKLISAVICAAAVCAVGPEFTIAVGAQDQTRITKSETDDSKTKVTTKTDVKEGTDVKAVGCLERNPSGGYMLTGIDSGELRYALITDDNLGKYVNHLVQVKGKATDLGKGKVTIETRTKVDDKVGTSGNVDEKTTVAQEGALSLRMMGLKSVKNLSKSCR